MVDRESLSEGQCVRDALFEARGYLDLIDPDACVDAVVSTLTDDDVVHEWVDGVAPDLLGQLVLLRAGGDLVEARELASDLLGLLIGAAPSGNDVERGLTPAEIRERDPNAFRPLAYVPREHVRAYLSGNGGSQLIAAPRGRSGVSSRRQPSSRRRPPSSPPFWRRYPPGVARWA